MEEIPMTTRDEIIALAEHNGIYYRATPLGTSEMFCFDSSLEAFYHAAQRQRDIADLNEVRQNDIDEFNRVNTELAALKAEPRSERTKQLEDSIAAFFDSEIPKGNALAQEMCMIGRKYRSQQDRIYKLEAGEFQEKFKASVSARSE